MTTPANDNAWPLPTIGMVPIIGTVGEGGEVTITDPTWRGRVIRPTPADVIEFPSDPREA